MPTLAIAGGENLSLKGSSMKYLQIKKQAEDRLSAFEGIFYAFSDEQFAKGMAKVGLKPEETGKVSSLGAGTFILKSRSDAFSAMFDEHEDAIAEMKKDTDELTEALAYELSNHEYCYNHDPEPALFALGYEAGEIDAIILKKAISIYLEGVE